MSSLTTAATDSDSPRGAAGAAGAAAAGAAAGACAKAYCGAAAAAKAAAKATPRAARPVTLRARIMDEVFLSVAVAGGASGRPRLSVAIYRFAQCGEG